MSEHQARSKQFFFLISLVLLLSVPSVLHSQESDTDEDNPPAVRVLISSIQKRVDPLTSFSAELAVQSRRHAGEDILKRTRGHVEMKRGGHFRLEAGLIFEDYNKIFIDASHYADAEGRAYQLSFSTVREVTGASWSVRRSYDAGTERNNVNFLTGLIGDGTEISLAPVIEYNLYPTSLNVFRNECTRSYVETDNTRYVVLSRERDWQFEEDEDRIDITEQVYIRPEDAIVEKVQYDVVVKDAGHEEHVIISSKATDWKEVGNVRIPANTNLVLKEAGRRAEMMYYLIEMNELQTGNEVSLKGTPSYAQDPAITDLVSGNSEEIAKNIREHPERPALYGQYLSAKLLDLLPALMNREIRFDQIDFPSIIKLLETGTENVDSWLVESVLATLNILRNRSKALHEQAERLHQNGRNIPFIQMASANRYYKTEQYEKAHQLYKRLQNVRYPYGAMANQRLLNTSIHTASPDELINILEKQIGDRSLNERYSILNRIESPVYNRGRSANTLLSDRSEEFLETLAASEGASEYSSLQLVLGRARARQKKYKKSIHHFRSLPEDEKIRDEINRTIRYITSTRRGEDKNEEITIYDFEPLLSNITHPVPLLVLAAREIENGEQEHAMERITRIHKKIKEVQANDDSDNRRRHNARSPWRVALQKHRPGLLNTLSFCQKQDKISIAKDLVKYLNENFKLRNVLPSRQEETDRFVNMIKKLFPNHEEIIYSISKKGGSRHSNLWSGEDGEFISKSKAVSFAVQRCSDGKPDRSDLRLLGNILQVYGLEHVPDVSLLISALEKVRERRPNDDFLMERLANVYYLDGQYDNAASLFTEELNHMTETGHYYGRVYAPASYTNSRRAPKLESLLKQLDGEGEISLDNFNTKNSVYVRAAMAFKQSDRNVQGRKVLKNHVESMKASVHGDEFLAIIKSFLILEELETAVSVTRNQFSKAFQKLQNTSDRRRRRRTLRDFQMIVEIYLQLFLARNQPHHARAVCDLLTSLGEKKNRGRGGNEEKLCKKARSRAKENLGELIDQLIQENETEVTEEEKKKINAQIDKLGNKTFRTREKAEKKLKQVGFKVVPHLKDVLNSNNPQVKNQAREIAQHYIQQWLRKKVLNEIEKVKQTDK